MTYNKKRMLSYGVILISVLLAYFCMAGKTEKYFCKKFCRPVPQLYLPGACTVPGIIYLEKHVVYKKMRRCLTAIGCLMVFWFFVEQ